MAIYIYIEREREREGGGGCIYARIKVNNKQPIKAPAWPHLRRDSKTLSQKSFLVSPQDLMQKLVERAIISVLIRRLQQLQPPFPS